MVTDNIFSQKQRDLLDYLIDKARKKQIQIPPINELGIELGLSSACLREQMELAKSLGIIKAQPRKGIEIQEYKFKPAVIKSLYYAVNISTEYFNQFSELRNQLERSFFVDCVKSLKVNEITKLNELTDQALKKLQGSPIRLPHQEHREFHLLIYSGLNNVFLSGLLETYWDIYELAGFSLYNDLDYLVSVWKYHQKIVENIISKNFDEAFANLVNHFALIDQRKFNK